MTGGRIVCFGELLLRLAAPGRELLLQSGRLDVHVGGAEANVAVGLARLGHDVAMVSRVPANPLGEAATGHLRRHGVDTPAVAAGEGRMGLYFLSPGAGPRPADILYDREGSAFVHTGPDDYHWEALLDGAGLLHVSGITPALGDGPAAATLAAMRTARSRGATVSFDGNYRAQLWAKRGGDPREVLTEIVAEADIFFGNHRDISLLIGRTFTGDGEARRREAAEAAFAAFPNLSMIASTARHVVDADTHRLAARVDERDGAAQTQEVAIAGIVDRIGAGDAFAAGVLHALRTGLDREGAARSGLALACLKHSLPGDASLFGQRDIDAFLAGEMDVRR
ncbi:sugar kinase [Sphingosinicella sp.]|uniref:sugar kinase n=1 Tax=Sphingosinicella sp. TaxID=1917971 RepID=UPI0040379CEF